jgi:hypothetical protein
MGIHFRELRELNQTDGSTLAGITAPQPLERIEKLDARLNAAGAVERFRFFRVINDWNKEVRP